MTPPVTPATTYRATSGVAQKGPLIKGSTVTAQELNAALSPTGAQYSYQITTNLGNFSPTSTFNSRYVGLFATGYYFDELANAVSSGTVTLNVYSDLAADAVLNVNLLTTLEYQRIQILVTKQNLSFAAARTQAEQEVLVTLNIPPGSYGSFDTLDIGGGTDGDHVLAAVSSLFVYGNSAGPLSQLIANFQSDMGTNGAITNPATTAALVTAAKGLNPATVAANLTSYYATSGLTFTAANISEWIAQSGDGVIGKYAFQVPDAAPSTLFTFPSSVVSQFAGTSVTVSSGLLSINGTPASGAVSFSAGDTVTLTPNMGDFPNGVLTSYLASGKTNLAKVSFVAGLVSIAVTPIAPTIPAGLTQQLKATGTFSDTSTADITNQVTWASTTPGVATIGSTTGLVNAVSVGSSAVTATSGAVSGNTTLGVTPAIIESIAITPNPATSGVSVTQQLAATGTFSDGSTQDVTKIANWSSSTQSVATIGPTTAVVVGASLGSTTISAAIGTVTGTDPLSVVARWLPTGSMTTERYGNTATLLPNGAVLVAGGSSTATAELYDLSTGTWSATGSMTTPRSGHTATLLPNGKVLAAGGVGSTGVSALATAEIYDPSSGTWSATGTMITARNANTVTLLQNGNVLVAGGTNGIVQSGAPVFSTAEIYSPSAGTWTATGSMTSARVGATATLLPNGSVLVASGLGTGTVGFAYGLATAEIYDPSAGTWTATGIMSTARYGHTATSLSNGTVLVGGGVIAAANYASAEIFDPSTGTFTATGSMTTPRYNSTATLLRNGTVLAAGGTFNGRSPLAAAEIYDPSTGTWTATASDPVARSGHTATLLANGEVLVVGGASISATELYQ
jgi:N-acetylneuraminic acid mutarotase